MIGDEMLLLAAALVLLFALPLALLAWMAAQYAQMRQLAARLEGLEVNVRDLRERGRTAAGDADAASAGMTLGGSAAAAAAAAAEVDDDLDRDASELVTTGDDDGDNDGDDGDSGVDAERGVDDGAVRASTAAGDREGVGWIEIDGVGEGEAEAEGQGEGQGEGEGRDG